MINDKVTEIDLIKIRISYFFRYLKWTLFDKTYVIYDGFNCGCCGRYIKKKFKVPSYKADEWWDSWGLCENQEECIKKV